MLVCPECASEYPIFARFCGVCGRQLSDPADAVDPRLAAEAEAVAAPEVPPEVDPWLGKVVERRYRVLSRIGSGGMGLVYKVEHIQLGKVAAMKVLHPDTAQNGEAVRRFRTEAQAVSRLNHPNIVQTFDFGQSEGALYLVMEYVKGEDLSAVIKRDGPLSFAEAAPLFVQICSALTEAHDAGVIHRDLKPENIVVVPRREGTAHAKVLDFGLAKLRERLDGVETTSGGQVIGTPYYMSPEQVRSEPLDERTDIYSLGATLYRVLTGTPPFQAATPVGVLTKHITDDLELPRARAPELNLPPEADAIVARAMAKSREDRYPTAAEVQRDLETAIFWGARRSTASGVAIDASANARLARRDGSTINASIVAEGAARARTERDQEGTTSGGGLPHEGDGAGGERLRRQDFDAFERSLRRRKKMATLVLPALLLIVAGGALWAFSRIRERASSVEREPNNTPGQATLLPLDTPVVGTVGKRLAQGQPDMDYFRVPPGKGKRSVSARLEGIPEVDLVLELFDAQGVALAKSDSHGGGGGEWLQPTAVGPGEAYLLVRQVWIQGTRPVEDVASPYQLAVHWGPPLAGWEVEPNDEPARATAVEPGHAIRGYLASAEDRDWFALVTGAASPGGRLVGRVRPPADVEIVVTVDDGSGAGRHGTRRTTESNQIDVPVTPGRRILVGLARKSPAGGEPVTAWRLVGLDDAYELTLELRPPP